MAAFELLGGSVTAPTSTETTLTAFAGNNFTLRASGPDSKIKLITMWAKVQGIGIFRLLSSRMHDQVTGINFNTLVSNLIPLLPYHNNQELYEQDTLIPSLSGSNTAGDIEQGFLLIHYDKLTGSDQRLETWDNIKSRIKNIMCVTNTITGGTAGGWSGSEAINADFDQLKANTDYALLGYTTNLIGGAVRWTGSDFGNLGYGGPLIATQHDITRNWFVNLSISLGLPAIPIINSANKSNTHLSVALDENGGSPVINSILAQL
jgi:hypothetical protein